MQMEVMGASTPLLIPEPLFFGQSKFILFLNFPSIHNGHFTPVLAQDYLVRLMVDNTLGCGLASNVENSFLKLVFL